VGFALQLEISKQAKARLATKNIGEQLRPGITFNDSFDPAIN
jgi:hypothetical protein